MPNTTSIEQNPIVPGFFPDPSVCRAGGTYYLVNSTFQYLPGIPVHASTNLLEWEQIGNVFSRREQLDLRGTISSGGLYAPTIRHHDGRFYQVTSDLHSVREGHLICSSEDAAGPWSVPVRTPGAIGIDPDLFWDRDGTCHLTWKGLSDTGLTGIISVPIDPDTGERQGEPRLLWQGTGEMASPEGPHLYERDGLYYCLLAEGGTEAAHSVTIARAESLDGPWEACPANPILTHRGSDKPVQNAGHADLFETEDGSWAAVFLGVRPRGNSPKYHVNGRETFIAGVEWKDGWPVFDETRFGAIPMETGFADEFTGELDPRWISHGGVHWDSVEEIEGGGLRISPVGSETGPVPAISVRARNAEWTAEADVTGGGTPAMQVHMGTDNWAEVRVEGDRAVAEFSICGIRNELEAIDLDSPRQGLVISAEAWPAGMDPSPGPDIIVLSVRTESGLVEVARLDGRLLSTEVTGGFVGRTVGVRAIDEPIQLERFVYKPTS